MTTTLAEAGNHCATFWCDYVSTQFDPAHLLSELGFTIVFDLILLFLVWGKMLKPYINRRFNKAHNELDAEHHVQHHAHEITADINDEPCAPEWHYDGDGVRRPGRQT